MAMAQTGRRHLAAIGLGVTCLALAACGQSEFAAMIEGECLSSGQNSDCSCIAKSLDDGLPDHLKTAFPALRWPLKPRPEDREAVNGSLLRSAGVDPADRQAVRSIRQEFKERMHALNAQTRQLCGGQI
jgi:hypothetical protein